jgi:type IV pilus assembly protein PilW
MKTIGERIIMMPHPNKIRGFTLVELLIAMAMSSIVLAGVVAAYSSQTRTHVTQQMVVDMQQNIRGAMYIMQREIRMAGHDPTGLTDASILVADDAQLQFQIDDNGDGDFVDGGGNDLMEQIRYAMTGGGALGRQLWNGPLTPLAENIDAINFVYLDGADPPNVLATPVADRSEIRSVQITIVARSGQNMPVFFYRQTDDRIYRNQQGTIILDMSAAPDSFRRQLLTAEVKCRNLGL